MSFRIKVPNAKEFSDYIKAISAIVDEGVFTIDESSIKFCAMDPAHISLVDFDFPKSAAEEYECSGSIELGVNMGEFLKFLKRAKGNEALELSYNDSTKKLEIKLLSATESIERVFTLSSLEISGGSVPSPKLTFDAKAKLDLKVFRDAIEDVSLVSDYVKISIAPEYVLLNAKGELGSSNIKMSRIGGTIYEIQTDKEVYGYFSIQYLEKILKACSSISKELLMELSTNKPIKLAISIPSGKLDYLIAPRIEAE